MAQNYTPDCFSSGGVWNTNLQAMENNFAALLSCFLGNGSPSNPENGMWWVDSGTHVLKLRYGGAWLSILNLSSLSFLIPAGNITAAMIADTAVKASIVAGQTIAPAIVKALTSVSAPTGSFTNLSATNFVASKSVLVQVPSGVYPHSTRITTPTEIAQHRVYIPPVAVGLRMSARLMHSTTNQTYFSYASFTINGATSSYIGENLQSYVWHNDAYLNISALSGYYTLSVNHHTTYAGAGGGMDGYTIFIE